MATSVSRYNLWERFRVVMWGIAALVPMQLLFIGYSVSQGQQVSFFTALQPAVMFGFALGRYSVSVWKVIPQDTALLRPS